MVEANEGPPLELCPWCVAENGGFVYKEESGAIAREGKIGMGIGVGTVDTLQHGLWEDGLFLGASVSLFVKWG